MSQREYQGISKRAKHLLNGQEDQFVDFKQSAAGMDSEDIVAFANTPKGGTILLGVEEGQKPDGRQYGIVIGCAVGDQERLSILGRAESCIPPIEVEVVTENLGDKPFFRIEIPSGPQKPYCTAKGTYKIRGDGANKPLTPRRLLTLFMESESQEFLDRFRQATQELNSQLEHLLSSSAMLEAALERTFSSAQSAEDLADNAVTLSDAAAAGTERILSKLQDLEDWHLHTAQDALDALLQRLGVEDPGITRARKEADNTLET